MDSCVIVICEECGRKYRVNPDRILGRAAGFSCRSCGHGIRVVKPAEPPEVSARLQRVDATRPGRPAFQHAGIGLRAKAWLVWGVSPGLALAAAWLLAGSIDDLGGPGGDAARLRLLLAPGGLIVTLAVGLAFGLRVTRRIGRLAAAAEHLASGDGGPATAPDCGDDLDRLGAALRDAGDRMRSRREEPLP